MRRDTFTDRRLERGMDRFKGNPKEEKTSSQQSINLLYCTKLYKLCFTVKSFCLAKRFESVFTDESFATYTLVFQTFHVVK